jgi:transcriptional regulator GlxA family with amidase domain
MKRRAFLAGATAVGGAGAAFGLGCVVDAARSDRQPERSALRVVPLEPPARGSIPVAFLISSGVTVIDFCGPWEVFQDVHVTSRGTMDEQMPFRLYTVSHSKDPIEGSGGLTFVPDHVFADAPAPSVVVVPAQGGSTPETFDWLRSVAKTADVTMSVCTGAFILARAGLLAGKRATTHHEFLDRFAQTFPDIQVDRGARFVENEKISTAGGLTSGVDLALHVVERYFGTAVAERTATYMEYQGQGWRV